MITSVDAACAMDAQFCLEIMGEIIGNHGAIVARETGNQCIAEEANRVANGFRVAGAIASAAQLAAIGGVVFDVGRASHIFRNAPGHVNPAAASEGRFMRLFESVASNPANLRNDAVQAGIITQDAANAGAQAFTVISRSGKQIWVTVRNGVIQNAGVNLPGAVR